MFRVAFAFILLAAAGTAAAEPTHNPPQPADPVVVPTGGKAGGVVGSRQP
jgi:hypothetical protein